MARKLAWLLAGVTLAASGGYTFVYLYRWEWNRALFTSLVFIAVEIIVALGLVMRRLARIEQRLEHDTGRSDGAEAHALAHLEVTAPTRRHFGWLEDSAGRMGVFITVLLGAGLLLSALTWLVDRIATRTARPTLERDLARRLGEIGYPTYALVPDDEELIAQGGPYDDDPALAILLGPRS